MVDLIIYIYICIYCRVNCIVNMIIIWTIFLGKPQFSHVSVSKNTGTQSNGEPFTLSKIAICGVYRIHHAINFQEEHLSDCWSILYVYQQSDSAIFNLQNDCMSLDSISNYDIPSSIPLNHEFCWSNHQFEWCLPIFKLPFEALRVIKSTYHFSRNDIQGCWLFVVSYLSTYCN